MYVCFEFFIIQARNFVSRDAPRKKKQQKSVCTDKNISIFSKISKVAETETETGEISFIPL